MKRKLKNYGLKISYPQENDYILGGLSKLGNQILQADGQWDEFLPATEYQTLGVETMACTAFGTLSACELLAKKKYGQQHNWSDRWLAWNAGITPQGASPHTTAEFLRKAGTPFQDKWDYTTDLTTWEKFYETPPPKLFDNARQDFLDNYTFGHEYVPSSIKAIKEALRYSPLGISVYAWKEYAGIYYKPDWATDNHWVVCYGWTEREGKFLLKVFDSYDNFTKLYDSMPTIIKRFELKKKESVSLWQRILNLFNQWKNRDSLRTFGATRSSNWPKVRAVHLKDNPTCAVCGGREQLEVHHCMPFHLLPSFEEDPENLITLCSKRGKECHLRFGHLDSFKSFNKDIKEDARNWNDKIKKRP